MRDFYGREIDYMRISITDRCNLRCIYCMPQKIESVPMSEILTYEEIAEIVKAAVQLGISHYRITGGEPLVRKGCFKLVRLLKEIPGVKTVGMTTNGVLLAEHAQALQKAGLDSINVSLDTVDPGRFKEMAGSDSLCHVLKGIDEAKQVGLPVKINTVNCLGTEWAPLLEFAEKKNIPIRFIEMMPIGYGKNHMGNSNEQLIKMMEERYGNGRAVEAIYGNGPAKYMRFERLNVDVGFISALHHKFCGSCNRIRLSAEGFLKLCLCYDAGIDLRSTLRDPEGSEALVQIMKQAIYHKPMEHCFDESSEMTEKEPMIRIGG